ncbi:hypothetical protein P280DRAFT_25299 [Massarina eburnea CBS 473.64]|uniref:Uncharacterized protein n=1 Tax=Massarina eburnea CBS 473.64 TaxID=1395130 RepID=A0A6A6RXD4_9PLEO|nr:hypothetical protein P280DRAFT_25299 [Massarina eburnea CBS 473.64]
MPYDGPKDVNTAWTDGHFALFVLADVSNDELSHVLEEAYNGSGEYHFWLADVWSNAPRDGEDATKPPVGEDWRSPFYGKTVEDVVAFMKKLPEDRYVDYHYFAVLGQDFTKRRMVTIYRVGDEDLIGDKLEALPCSIAGSTLFLSAIESHYWEETKANYPKEDEPVG